MIRVDSMWLKKVEKLAYLFEWRGKETGTGEAGNRGKKGGKQQKGEALARRARFHGFVRFT